MSQHITLLNGPNLNLLGKRQPEIYGHATLADIEKTCADLANSMGLALDAFQSNHEGQLVDFVHQAREKSAAIIINPAAYSHTSVALFDALSAFDGIVLEVHISNIHKREAFRHHSYVSARAEGIIAGCGVHGYELAVRQVAHMLASA